MHKRLGLVALTSTAEIRKGGVSQLVGDVGRRKAALMVSFGYVGVVRDLIVGQEAL
jgi:hypothetical protein